MIGMRDRRLHATYGLKCGNLRLSHTIFSFGWVLTQFSSILAVPSDKSLTLIVAPLPWRVVQNFLVSIKLGHTMGGREVEKLAINLAPACLSCRTEKTASHNGVCGACLEDTGKAITSSAIREMATVSILAGRREPQVIVSPRSVHLKIRGGSPHVYALGMQLGAGASGGDHRYRTEGPRPSLTFILLRAPGLSQCLKVDTEAQYSSTSALVMPSSTSFARTASSTSATGESRTSSSFSLGSSETPSATSRPAVLQASAQASARPATHQSGPGDAPSRPWQQLPVHQNQLRN